ncbi:hypothetical protein BDV59DRAFT_170439 [Aspergillus ambiguus]|uniref:uncharacterized protein n=1 Tax=Aspergillus ambiguus TaxID=176160 RepID=UPI003CCD1379
MGVFYVPGNHSVALLLFPFIKGFVSCFLSQSRHDLRLSAHRWFRRHVAGVLVWV